MGERNTSMTQQAEYIDTTPSTEDRPPAPAKELPFGETPELQEQPPPAPEELPLEETPELQVPPAPPPPPGVDLEAADIGGQHPEAASTARNVPVAASASFSVPIGQPPLGVGGRRRGPHMGARTRHSLRERQNTVVKLRQCRCCASDEDAYLAHGF